LKNHDSQNQTSFDNPNQKPKNNPAKKKRFRKIAIYTLSVFLFLFLIIIPLLLNIFADRIIGRTLSDIVRIETNGTYNLRFSDVSLNVFKRDISFDSLFLIPDSAIKYSDTARVSFFTELFMPKVHLKGASWIQVITKRELIVDDFSVLNPEVKMCFDSGFSPVVSDSIALDAKKMELQNVFGYIKKYLNRLTVKQFRFINGSLMATVEP